MILVTGGIDDLCMKYFVEAKAMAVRRCKTEDLKRIARATGGMCVLSKETLLILASYVTVLNSSPPNSNTGSLTGQLGRRGELRCLLVGVGRSGDPGENL